MKEFKSLKILDKTKFIFDKTKVDYHVMRRILEVKLTLDGRRVSVFEKSQGKKVDTTDSSFLKSYWLYILMGLFLIPFGFLGDTPFIGLNLFFGVVLFMLISTMISDFSSVILDTKDKIILLTKPVSQETLTMARFIHIFIYLVTLMLMIAVPGILSFAYNYGILFGLLLFFVMGLLCLLSILGTSFIYTLLMRYYEGEKLKDIINIFQIFFVLTLNIGYQVLIRMFSFIDFQFVFTPKWWTYLLPPSWFAALFEIIFFSRDEIQYIILSLLAVFVPIVSLIVHVKIIAPGFEQYLSRLDTVEKGKVEKKNLRYRMRQLIDQLISRTPTEKAFIKFTRVMLKKERSVKFRVFPMLTMALAFPIIFLIMSALDQEGVSFLTALKDRSNVFFFYISTAMISQTLVLISFSDSYKGAWIYKVMPIKNKQEVLKGSVKGLFLTYVLPMVLFFTVLGLYLYGIYALLDFTIIFSASYIGMMISFKSNKKRYPFSEKHTQEKQNESSIQNLVITVIVVGAYFLMHRFLRNNIPFLALFAAIVIVFDYIMWQLAFKGNWES